MNPDIFRHLIRKVLNEEVEKKSVTNATIFERVPEVVHGKDYNKIMPNPHDKLTKDDLLSDMDKMVKAIDPNYTTVWDDHDDLQIWARDLFRIRVIPKWENNFSIEAMTRNEDRIFMVGQTWEQVKQFVKINFKDSKSMVTKDYDKVVQNQKALPQPADKGLNQKDKPKTLPPTNEPSKEKKNKEKDYKEDQTEREEDLPEKPLKDATEFKRQEEHKSVSPLTLRREKTKYPSKKPNTTLTYLHKDEKNITPNFGNKKK